MVLFLHAAWWGRGVFGWQDWRCPVDRAVMVDEWIYARDDRRVDTRVKLAWRR